MNVLRVSTTYPFDISDARNMVGAYDNVFIGVVTDELLTDEETKVLPATYFSVDVMDNLKGEAKANVIIKKRGGVNDSGDLVLFEDDFLPKVGSTYIFTTSIVENTIGHNGDVYVVSSSYQKIFLGDDYKVVDFESQQVQDILYAIENEVVYQN